MDLSRFSLEYLPSGVNFSSSSFATPKLSVPTVSEQAKYPNATLGAEALSTALETYTGPILSELKKSSNIHVFDLFDQISAQIPSTDIANFQSIVKWLIDNGVVNLIQSDRYGNHLIAKA